MTARDHNNLLSIFFFIQGGLQTFAAIILVVVYGMFGAIFGIAMTSAAKGQDKLVGPFVGGFFVLFAVIIGLFIMLFAGLNLIAGWKLRKEKPSAKIWATIASAVVILGFPLGTALGIYGFWFLYGDMGKQLYWSGGPRGFNNAPPPPPQSWR